MPNRHDHLGQSMERPTTLAHLLRLQAEREPSRTAYRFLTDDGSPSPALTSGEVLQWSEAVAAELSGVASSGDRAALLVAPGLPFVVALLACFLTGVVAVPAPPPSQRADSRRRPRLLAIWHDADPCAILSAGPSTSPPNQRDGPAPPWEGVPWLDVTAVDHLVRPSRTPPLPEAAAVALLQYTSGSTARPKGVAISHGNVLANCEAISTKGRLGRDDVGVFWVPPYHDMGLLGGILTPLYCRFPAVLMSPASFMKSPLRWLEALSTYRGTVSATPTFGLDACTDTLPSALPDGLDLTSWSKVFVGAEPVRAHSLDRFAQALAPAGFRRGSLYPCYGLAESTLFVTGGVMGREPTVHERTAAGGEGAEGAGSGPPLVGCGWAAPDHEVVVVDPATGLACPDGTVGEICVAGPSVALGYWRDEAATAAAFQVLAPRGAGAPARRYLRTGDLGFVHDGELYITGRRSGMLILRGRKLFPEDVETSVSRHTHRLGRTAAFGLDDGHDEHLIVVQAVSETAVSGLAEARHVVGDVLQAVAEDHDVQPSAVVLVPSTGLPLTTSGKVRRAACRDAYASGRLPVVHQWTHPRLASGGEPLPAAATEDA